MINNNFNVSVVNNSVLSSPVSPNSPKKRERPAEFKGLNDIYPQTKRKLNLEDEVNDIGTQTLMSIEEDIKNRGIKENIYLKVKLENVYGNNYPIKTVLVNKDLLKEFGLEYFDQKNGIYIINDKIDQIFHTKLSNLSKKELNCILALNEKIHFSLEKKLLGIRVEQKNLYQLLFFSKKLISKPLLEKCINYIDDFDIEYRLIDNKFYLSVSINSFSNLTLLDKLIKLFNDKVEISLNDKMIISKPQTNHFIKKYSDKIVSLKLSKIQTIKAFLPKCVNLKKLSLNSRFLTSETLNVIENMEHLTFLKLHKCNQIKLLPNLDHFKHLKFLSILDCSNLQKIPLLPKTINELNILNCPKIKQTDYIHSFLSIITKENLHSIDSEKFLYFKTQANENSLIITNILDTIKTYPLFFTLEQYIDDSRFKFYYELVNQKNFSRLEKTNQLVESIISFFSNDIVDHSKFFIDNLIQNKGCRISYKQIIKNNNLNNYIEKKLEEPTVENYNFAKKINLAIPTTFSLKNFFSISEQEMASSLFISKRINHALCNVDVLINQNTDFKNQALEFIKTDEGVKFITHPRIRQFISGLPSFFNLISTTYPETEIENNKFYSIIVEELIVKGFFEITVSMYHLQNEPLITLFFLTELFLKKTVHNVNVVFKDDPSYDGGGDGITRHFLYLLFGNISKHYSLNKTIPSFSKSNEIFFERIGILLSFLLTRKITNPETQEEHFEFPIGPIFTNQFFRGLFLFSVKELENTFGNI
ncbi:MAG: hypothetical protein Q8K60_04030, partial [Parachlamydiaceae bacterium]|nr:hypothetical protein [Parachlamydiaceae bacterium]